jgi:hypothetical protein
MAIVYREEKGSNLGPVELDGNFREHDQRIALLESTRPQPDNFANVTLTGPRITFTLISGATFAFDLPVLKWRWRGEWTAFTPYAAVDTFSVAGVGVFLVLLDHTSAATFDGTAADAGDIVTAGAFVIDVAYTILTVGSTDFMAIGASANTIGIVFTATGAGSGSGTATINLPFYQELFALGVDLFAAGVGTFLGTPTSANLIAAVTDETGTGLLVFNDSPVLAGIPTADTASPADNSTQLATTAYADAAAAATMAGITATATEINQYILTLEIADGSAEAVYYLVCPHAGDIKSIQTVIDGAVSTADITITSKIGATGITGGVVTIATSSSAAGDIDSATPSALNTVTAGQAVNFTVTGGGAGGSPRIHLAMVIER